MGKEQDCKNDLALKKCQTELLEIKNWWHSKRREISQKRGENKNNDLNVQLKKLEKEQQTNQEENIRKKIIIISREIMKLKTGSTKPRLIEN